MDTKDLQEFGYFRELEPLSSTPLPSIFEHISQQSLPDRDKVVKYLKLGYQLMDVLDNAKDVFGGGEVIMGGSAPITDGTWVWRADSSYYVDRHNIQLPETFLAHIRGQHYLVPHQEVATLKACYQEVRARGLFGGPPKSTS